MANSGMMADQLLKPQDPSKMLAVVDEETKEDYDGAKYLADAGTQTEHVTIIKTGGGDTRVSALAEECEKLLIENEKLKADVKEFREKAKGKYTLEAKLNMYEERIASVTTLESQVKDLQAKLIEKDALIKDLKKQQLQGMLGNAKQMSQ